MNAPVHLPAAKVRPAPAQSLEKRRLQLYLVLLLGDVALIALGFATSGLLYRGEFGEFRAMLAGQLMLPLFLTLALYNGTYSLSSLESWRYGVQRMAVALLLSSALVNFIVFFARASTQLSRASFAIGLLVSVLLLAGWRLIVSRQVQRRYSGRLQNVLVIDAGGPAVNLPGAYRVDAAQLDLRPDPADPQGLDRIGKAMRNMDRVIVSTRDEEREAWVEVLRGSGVTGELASEAIARIDALGLERHAASNLTTLLISRGPLRIRDRVVKRAFDLALSSLALVLLAVPLALVAVAIKLDDGGPVLFRQRRMGRANRFFDIWKFRTMRVDAADSAGAVSTGREDERVTRLGRFLRASSIDELPQLVNILLGQMSFVGPRPHAIGSQAGSRLFWDIDRRYSQRHSLKPGLTGLAQVRGLRGATETEEHLAARLQADLEYAARWSLWQDCLIMLRTARVIVHERAY